MSGCAEAFAAEAARPGEWAGRLRCDARTSRSVPTPLTLYDHPASTNALKVRLLLAELGLEARRIEVPLGEDRPPEYAEVHPFGLIPALRDADADLVVTESNTALRYLAEREDRWDLRGADARTRARVDGILDSLSLEVRPHLWAVETLVLYGAEVPESEREARREALHTALAGFERLLDPTGPHALGPGLTIADCAIAGRGLHLDRLPVGEGAAPRLRRVLRAAFARPAFERVLASPR